jgi:hypothetical protein
MKLPASSVARATRILSLQVRLMVGTAVGAAAEVGDGTAVGLGDVPVAGVNADVEGTVVRVGYWLLPHAESNEPMKANVLAPINPWKK